MERMKNMLRKSVYRMYNWDNYIVVGRKRKRGQESDRNDSWIKGGLKSLFFIRFF